ncbi:MAG: hypothetical protein L0332_09455 [Chloroflexi bacterium]|nr:hypothetical protein [Chloroflexota bacterium]MCI0579860.1 hypothetical protein [Chloroflexota bacterium]MCI0643260.1 hypothetical protein [Chloroflexota bacterium]MCI0726932.1 hypothetical protein [Chloroflexota bacterium]
MALATLEILRRWARRRLAYEAATQARAALAGRPARASAGRLPAEVPSAAD